MNTSTELSPGCKDPLPYQAWKDFVEEVCGGEDNIIGLTCEDVLQRFMLPFAAQHRMSYAAYYHSGIRDSIAVESIIKTEDPIVSKMNVNSLQLQIDTSEVVVSDPKRKIVLQVIFSWQDVFADVLLALDSYFERHPKLLRTAVLWNELFQMHHHYFVSDGVQAVEDVKIDTDRGLEYTNFLQDCWIEYGNALLIMTSWDEAKVLQCPLSLYQLYICNMASLSFIHVIMPPVIQQHFDEMLMPFPSAEDMLQFMVPYVHAKTAIQVSMKNPRLKMLYEYFLVPLIPSKSSELRFLDIVVELIREWILKYFYRKRRTGWRSTSRNPTPKSGRSLMSSNGSPVGFSSPDFGQQLIADKKFEEAEVYYLQQLDVLQATLPPGDTQILDTMNRLAKLFTRLNKIPMAEVMMVSHLKLLEDHHGRSMLTMTSVQSLAHFYAVHSEFGKAMPLYERYYDFTTQYYGEMHHVTLHAGSMLAMTLARNHREQEAKALSKRCLEIARLQHSHNPNILEMFEGNFHRVEDICDEMKRQFLDESQVNQSAAVVEGDVPNLPSPWIEILPRTRDNSFISSISGSDSSDKVTAIQVDAATNNRESNQDNTRLGDQITSFTNPFTEPTPPPASPNNNCGVKLCNMQ